MKWALVIVYLSGNFDTGLRYQSYDACMLEGVRESYMHLLEYEHRVTTPGLSEYDIYPPAREAYHEVFRCLPTRN